MINKFRFIFNETEDSVKKHLSVQEKLWDFKGIEICLIIMYNYARGMNYE